MSLVDTAPSAGPRTAPDPVLHKEHEKHTLDVVDLLRIALVGIVAALTWFRITPIFFAGYFLPEVSGLIP